MFQRNSWLKRSLAAFAASIGFYAFNEKGGEFLASKFFVFAKKKREVQQQEVHSKLSYREKRFLNFASVEYNGTVFLTPRDFLNAVTQDLPTNQLKHNRITMSSADLEQMLKRTPTFNKSSKNFFHDLDSDGIVSYTEYLFLLCILTKPEEGFKIAFNMFDTDRNGRVDKKEFLILETVMGRGRRKQLLKALEKAENVENEVDKPIKSVWGKSHHRIEKSMKVQDTSLLIHFFGPKGDQSVTYEDFRRFMDNVQTEVLKIEFSKFARGKSTITELDFARMLLRNTTTAKSGDQRNYIERLNERLPKDGNITFDQFRLFCRFLNTLDDFTIAVKLFTLADLPVSPAEFARAIKVSTGFALEPHLVDVIFKIFDTNNDGRLSYSEFIAIMKDRLYEGFRARAETIDGRAAFWRCVRQELKRY